MTIKIPQTLTEAACCVLNEPAPNKKVELTRSFANTWASGLITDIGTHFPPDRPARPHLPELKPPADMPRRRKTGLQGKRAFIHSIAHIELNAIDLAWDIICRFVYEDMPIDFYNDWVCVALDEAEHFNMLVTRLNSLAANYGDLAAHDGLWEAADKTKDDLASRLALVPMILEARGLDTTPIAVKRFKDAGDTETAAILDQIGAEEMPHVAAGVRWFEFICNRRGVLSVFTFHEIVATLYKGKIKPPFNIAARTKAGMSEAYYQAEIT
jgi:uncharacterized ferritin-like protein (DUF455 family)